MFKQTLKKTLHAVCFSIVLPLLLLYWLLKPVSRQDELFASFAQFLSLLPGTLGSYLRIAFYRRTMRNCAADCYIGFATLFSQQSSEIAEGVYIGPQSNIGLSAIGANTLLGSGVHLLSGKNQHRFDDPTRPIKDQGGQFEKITIGANCWVGNGAIIMACVGDGSIIGAGSVVIHDIPAGVIAAGNPAKVIKTLHQAAATQG